ncbi:MAG: FumA C-terminus/TtdB family hydratase beta subunit [Methanomicrobiales archaeon]|nr:FumA C-terminus/TtdB family hydratase beta subunit [Methanomicrobiales archaeon]
MILHTPLDERVLGLHAGDRILLSGTIFTARDRAHERMLSEGIPFDPRGAVIYHSGPLVKEGRIVAAGPTTSARLDPFTPPLIEAGVRGVIGKGGMGADVAQALVGRGIYLAFTGGCAALAASRMRLKGVIWEDLGMAEAIWIIELNELPLVVGIDAHGRSLYAEVHRTAERAFAEREYGKDAIC